MESQYKPSAELSLVLNAAALGCHGCHDQSDKVQWKQLDWDKTLKLANFHGLSCWLAEYIKDVEQVPAEVVNKLANKRRKQLLSLTFIEQQKSQIVTTLQQSNVRFALLKGGAIARPLYQQRWYYRPMADIDILIHPEQFKLAYTKLRALGYVEKDSHSLKDSDFEQIATYHQQSTVIEHTLLHPNGYFEVDIHWKLKRNSLLPIDYHNLFNAINVNGSTMPQLSEHLSFIYLCVNGMNDGWRKLRALVDILYYVQNISDWTKIHATAKALGLLHVVNASLAICDLFFSTEYAPKQLNKKEYLMFRYVCTGFATANELPTVHSYLDNRNFYYFIKSCILWWYAVSSEITSARTLCRDLLSPNVDDLSGKVVVTGFTLFRYCMKRITRLIRDYYLSNRS